MKFSHLADCHLGGWRHPELRTLNLESFKKALDISIEEKVDFVLIAGDLFDSAYPPVEILEETFFQLKRLKDLGIACYLIAGSHDYSASGKTFLSVLEKAGFCKNLYHFEEREDKIFLNPTIHKNVALYGYPGKKSGMEVEEIKKIKLQESPGFFRVFALHTCIKDAVKSLPIESVEESSLPEAEYYALGHLHINYKKNNFIYSGPTFPNNFQELEELKYGSFYIVDTSPVNIRRIELPLKESIFVELEIENALTATELIISELDKRDIKDKILLLKLFGKIKQGKTSNINFKQIEDYVKSKFCYVLLKSTSKLVSEEQEFNIEIENSSNLEEDIIKDYLEKEKSQFNDSVFSLISVLSAEKQEGETSQVFESRLFSELNKVFKTEIK